MQLTKAMQRVFILSFLILTACVPQSATQATEVIVIPSLIPRSTLTPTLIPATVASLPTIPPSETPIPCDPYTVDYCITDGHFIFQRPIQPPEENFVDPTYRYASTADGARDPHHGVELGKDFGAPVHAAADGVVLYAGPDAETQISPWKNFYGNVVVIQHAGEVYSLYAHLSEIDVQTRQAVKMGEQIGAIGQSGAATGSHLHFEVRLGEPENYFATQNPELWLMPVQTDFGAIAFLIVNEVGEFQNAELTLQRYSDANEVDTIRYVETYHPTLATGAENAALGDLPAGRYRVALLHNGHLYERWVAVQSGKLTQVVIVVR